MPSTQPLAGKRILITRSREQGQELERRFSDAGAEVVWCPLLSIHPPTDPHPLQLALTNLDHFQWVVFSSRNGVEQTFRAWDQLGQPGAWPSFAVVGTGTAQSLLEHDQQATVLPEQQDAPGLVMALRDHLGTENTVLLPQAHNARPLLREGLSALGAQVTAVEAYQGLGISYDHPPVDVTTCDAITFASSATVKRFAAIPRVPKHWPAPIAIGRHTAATLEQIGQPARAVATNPDMASLVAAAIAGLT